MLRRKTPWIVLLSLLAGGLVWWWTQDTPPTAPAAPPSRKPQGTASPAAPPAAPPAAALPEYGSRAFKQLVMERGAAWLASRNRDALSLLAMWNLSGEESLLMEAAEKFPGNPQVCLTMLNQLLQGKADPGQKRLWVDRLIEAAPDNPLGYYHLAQLHAEQGNATAVIESLHAAIARQGRMNTYLREHVMAAKEGLLSGGASLKEANFLALVGPMQQQGVGAMVSPVYRLNRFFKDQLAAMKADGRDEERQALAAVGLQMAEQTRLSESPPLITELSAHGQKVWFLKELDPETEIANTGRTAALELAAMDERKAELTELMQIAPAAQEFLEKASLEVQSRYTDRMMMDGEMAALRELMAEMKKTKP